MTKKRVSFPPGGDIQITTNIKPCHSMTDDEKSAIWYQKHDLEYFKISARSVCRRALLRKDFEQRQNQTNYSNTLTLSGTFDFDEAAKKISEQFCSSYEWNDENSRSSIKKSNTTTSSITQDDDVCLRGLEYRICRKRQVASRATIGAVLQCQRLINMGPFSDGVVRELCENDDSSLLLSKVSRTFSRSAKDEAVAMGATDALLAARYATMTATTTKNDIEDPEDWTVKNNDVAMDESRSMNCRGNNDKIFVSSSSSLSPRKRLRDVSNDCDLFLCHWKSADRVCDGSVPKRRGILSDKGIIPEMTPTPHERDPCQLFVR